MKEHRRVVIRIRLKLIEAPALHPFRSELSVKQQ